MSGCITQKNEGSAIPEYFSSFRENFSAFFITAAPPKTLDTTLSRPKLKKAASPTVPTSNPFEEAPSECAQSSISKILFVSERERNDVRSAGIPNVCWRIIAFVEDVTFFL